LTLERLTFDRASFDEVVELVTKLLDPA